jgi:hypothetical protein
MYASCMLVLWAQRKSKKFSIFLMIYLTILFTILFVFMTVQAATVQVVYIDNRNYPGGPWAYFLATQNLPVNVIFIATFFLLTLFADSLIVRFIFHTIRKLLPLLHSFGVVGSYGLLLGNVPLSLQFSSLA